MAHAQRLPTPTDCPKAAHQLPTNCLALDNRPQHEVDETMPALPTKSDRSRLVDTERHIGI
jgi:hypothetical protein